MEVTLAKKYVPVIVHNRYPLSHRRKKAGSFFASAVILADESGSVVAAGLSAQSQLDNPSKKIGRTIAMGRAVSALVKDIVNGPISTDSAIHSRRVNEALETNLFEMAKGVPPHIARVSQVSPFVQDLINEAIARKTRVVVDLNSGKWSMTE